MRFNESKSRSIIGLLDVARACNHIVRGMLPLVSKAMPDGVHQ